MGLDRAVFFVDIVIYTTVIHMVLCSEEVTRSTKAGGSREVLFNFLKCTLNSAG